MVDVLLPIVTLLLGFVSAALLEYWKDKRLDARERARLATQREEEIALRRDAFQRDALLNLQQALFDYVSGKVELHKAAIEALRAGAHQMTAEVDHALLSAEQRMKLYKVRILDDDVSNLIDELLIDSADNYRLAKDEREASAALEGTDLVFGEANDRIGFLLRTLY